MKYVSILVGFFVCLFVFASPSLAVSFFPTDLYTGEAFSTNSCQSPNYLLLYNHSDYMMDGLYLACPSLTFVSDFRLSPGTYTVVETTFAPQTNNTLADELSTDPGVVGTTLFTFYDSPRSISVSSVTTNSLSSFSSVGMGSFASMLPIAFGLIISVAVVFWVIRHFRGLIKGQGVLYMIDFAVEPFVYAIGWGVLMLMFVSVPYYLKSNK